MWETAYRELAEQQGARCTPELWERMAGRSLEASVAQLFTHAGLAVAPSAIAQACTWLVTRIHQLLEDQPALLKWRPGAEQALQMVQRAAIPTALVTTTWRSLTDHIITALDVRFDATVCGDEVARGKPAPDPYLRAAALLATSPAGCVVVEDTPAGVSAAEAAGIAVLAVPSHTAIAPQARRVVRSSLLGLTLDELTAIAAPPDR